MGTEKKLFNGNVNRQAYVGSTGREKLRSIHEMGVPAQRKSLYDLVYSTCLQILWGTYNEACKASLDRVSRRAVFD